MSLSILWWCDVRQEYVANVAKLARSPQFKFRDLRNEIIAVPNFYAAFFGTNNKQLFVDLSGAVARAAPECVWCVVLRHR